MIIQGGMKVEFHIQKVMLEFNGKYSPSYLYLPEKIEKKIPAIVLCHGNYYEGKDAVLIRNLAESIAEMGFVVLSFDNLCYNLGWKPKNNVVESPEEVDFRWATYSAVTFLGKQEYIDETKIAVVGHSMGGSIALAVAATDDRVCGVVSISPTRVSRFIFDEKKTEDFWSKNVKERLDTKISINTMKTIRCVLLEESYVSLLANKPVLLMYGRRERFWGYNKWIQGLSDAIGENSHVISIPKAGHYFGKEPDESEDQVFYSLVGKMNQWLTERLKKEEECDQ